jgi:hypothetical protein
MSEKPRRRRGVVPTFLFGGVVGGLVAVAAPRVRRVLEPREGPLPVAGLEAFEGAPCWEYDRGERVAADEPGDEAESII